MRGPDLSIAPIASGISVKVEREASKVSIKRIPNPILERLLEIVCIPVADRTRFMTELLAGDSESAAIERSAPAVSQDGVKPLHFNVVSDVRRRTGLSEANFRRLRPFITIYGYHERPELTGAALPVVMAALDIDAKKARSFDSENRTTLSIQDRTGILSIAARTSEAGKAPFETRATVYFTGAREEPFKILEIDRQQDFSRATDCAPLNAEAVR